MSPPKPGSRPAGPAPPSGAPPRAKAAEGIENAVRRIFAPHLAGAEGEGRWDTLRRRWLYTQRSLRPLGGMSLRNRVDVYDDGDEVFEAMWEAIRGARRTIRMATYILDLDAVGERMLEELLAASARGVAVTLQVDAIGSPKVEDAWGDDLRDAGVELIVARRIPLWRLPSKRWIERDHRKVLVVDDAVAFCGGMNVTVEYAGERLGEGLFRDTHARLVGPCAADLARLIADRPPRPVPDFEKEPRADPAEGSFVQVLESDRRRGRRAIQRALRLTLARAKERCILTSPYFLPPRKLRRAITKAAERGVEVRILTAGRCDVPVVRLASRHVYGRFLRAGVRLFELQQPILHAKTTAIDGVYAMIGSFNLDLLSDRRNREVLVAVLDPEVAGELERQFERDLERSTEVTLATWERRGPFVRVLEWLFYSIGRLI